MSCTSESDPLAGDKRAWATELVGRTAAGRYRLIRLIEVGGMGAVFEAEDLEEGPAVAIKVLVPGLLNNHHSLERLAREARRASEVKSRGVVDVLEFVADAEIGPFLVMELLVGESLSERLRREGRLEVGAAVGLAVEALEILEQVHRRSILHRDLKPGNLFLAREGGEEVLKILDFGLARSLDPDEDEATLTVPGTVVGTPRYMAPEQARADKAIDQRADLYSVGALLYRTLSGKQPYAEWGSREVILAVRAGPCSPLSQVSPSVPHGIAAVVDRAMRLDPDDRPQTATELREALLDALHDARSQQTSVQACADEETVEERTTLPERPASSHGPRRWLVAGIIGLLGLTAAWVIVGSPTRTSDAAPAVAPTSTHPTPSMASPSPETVPPRVDATPAASAPVTAPRAAVEPPRTPPDRARTVPEPRARRRALPPDAPDPPAPPARSTEAAGRSGSLRRDQF